MSDVNWIIIYIGIFLEKILWTPSPPPCIKKCTKNSFLIILINKVKNTK